jgi:hypothetical protein
MLAVLRWLAFLWALTGSLRVPVFMVSHSQMHGFIFPNAR